MQRGINAIIIQSYLLVKMSTSCYGFCHGRNTGLRGRINNKDPKLAMNPKQFVNGRKRDLLISQSNNENAERHTPIEPSKGVVAETNRLKRKQRSFEEEFQKQYEKKTKKNEIKSLAKEVAKKERELKKVMAQRQNRSKPLTETTDNMETE
jgi:hypothetical protein